MEVSSSLGKSSNYHGELLVITRGYLVTCLVYNMIYGYIYGDLGDGL